MALPKRKISKTKSRSRRAAWNNKLQMASVQKCSNCGESKIMHHVCPQCGFYNGRLVINTEN